MLLAIALAACGATPVAPASLEPVAATSAIPGTVTTARAIDLLTETTLGCEQVEPRDGLDQWFCIADDREASDGATFVVTLLADGQAIHVIDAQVLAVPGAGPLVDYLPFFRETVIQRLAPEISADPTVTPWLAGSIDSPGSLEVAGTRLTTRVAERLIELQLLGQS